MTLAETIAREVDVFQVGYIHNDSHPLYDLSDIGLLA